MDIQEKLYSVEEFWEIALLPENQDKNIELINGVILEMPLADTLSSIVEAWIGYLSLVFEEPKNIGYVTAAYTSYRLSPYTLAEPDVAYISKERSGPISSREFPVGPDLAVEVISPSETATTINDKIRAYFGAGTRQVWLVYPTTQTVHVYSASDQVQILGVDGEIDASSAIPGFRLKVARIFERVGK